MNILVLNTAILAVDPQDNGDAWTTADQIIPKHVAEGATLVDVVLPEDYAPGKYTYNGGFVPVAPIPPSVEEFDKALTDHLDKTAQARKYDNRITCAVRAGYPGPFQAEGIAFAEWMDGCNKLAYQWQAEIEAGTKPVFASTSDFLNALPAMVWPT